MSWAALSRWRPPSITPSVAETRRFGLTCARLEVADDRRADEALPTVQAALREHRADLVVVRYPQRLVGWFAGLVTTGRDVLQADSLVYWRLPVGSGRRTPGHETSVALEQVPADEVAAFVGATFTDYGNHYAADPLLDPDAALAGYQEWAVGSASRAGAVALRLATTGELAALATTSRGEDHLEIELAGVSPDLQGRSLYADLLAGVEDLAAREGVPEVVISTQGHNVRVQRAWARYGFEPLAAFTTVHALRRGLLPGPGGRPAS